MGKLKDFVDKYVAPERTYLTRTPTVGSVVNTFTNPFARITGPYYVPKALEKFPSRSDPYLNATLYQTGAVGLTSLALAGLIRYVMGAGELEQAKIDSDARIKKKLGVEDEAIELAADPDAIHKSALSTGDFFAFALPMAALAVGLSGGYALANKRLADEQQEELDAGLEDTRKALARERVMAAQPSGLSKAALGLPSLSTLTAFAGLALASTFATSAIISKRKFDSADEARVNAKASEAALKSLARARAAAEDVDLRIAQPRARETKRRIEKLIGARSPAALPEAAPEIPVAATRPYESVPV